MRYETARDLLMNEYPARQADATSESKNAFHFPMNDGVIYIYPTLSELIEACGDRFVSLSLQNREENKWGACGGNDEYTYYGRAATPEDAVAELWMQLQKKI